MKRLLFILVACIFAVAQGAHGAGTAEPPKPEIRYGANDAAGSWVQLNGIRMYYERYGSGPPVLMIHGNGGSIARMMNQIAYFSSKYQVIVADSRGHGKSEMGTGQLTYEQMSEDTNALLEHLGLKSVDVLGISDGGIIALLLAMNHPDKVGKAAIMGANLNPQGAYDWAFTWCRNEIARIDAMIAKADQSEPWARRKQIVEIMLTQPNISVEALHRVRAPTLVMVGDRDVIRDDHTLQIFHALPNAQLCVFPGATHFIARQDPTRFNLTVDAFFTQPFTMPDTRDSAVETKPH